MGRTISAKEFQWQNIYENVFVYCKDNILQNFQFNFLHRNIATNKLFLQCKLTESSLCDFCCMYVESIEHLFWDCQTVQIFWNNLFKWQNKIAINFTYDNFTSFFQAKDKKTSYIFLFSKYYIYTSKLKNKL
jgi:hypothetical protein